MRTWPQPKLPPFPEKQCRMLMTYVNNKANHIPIDKFRKRKPGMLKQPWTQYQTLYWIHFCLNKKILLSTYYMLGPVLGTSHLLFLLIFKTLFLLIRDPIFWRFLQPRREQLCRIQLDTGYYFFEKGLLIKGKWEQKTLIDNHSSMFLCKYFFNCNFYFNFPDRKAVIHRN